MISYIGEVLSYLRGMEIPRLIYDEQQQKQADKILGVLKKSQEFQKLMQEINKKQIVVEIYPVDEDDCEYYSGSDDACVKVFNSIFLKKAQVFVNNELTLREQVKYVLMELCNANHLEEYDQLHYSAKSTMNAYEYALAREKIEFKAFQRNHQIAETITDFKEPLWSETAKKASNTWKDYLKMVKESGHFDNYKKQYDELW